MKIFSTNQCPAQKHSDHRKEKRTTSKNMGQPIGKICSDHASRVNHVRPCNTFIERRIVRRKSYQCHHAKYRKGKCNHTKKISDQYMHCFFFTHGSQFSGWFGLSIGDGCFGKPCPFSSSRHRVPGSRGYNANPDSLSVSKLLE